MRSTSAWSTWRRCGRDIDRHVLRDRELDYSQPFLPETLTGASELEFLTGLEQRFLSQVQGRTYVSMLRLAERWIVAKKLELSADQALCDQRVVAELVRSSVKELEHQALFGRIEESIARWMPPGYRFDHDPSAVARILLGRCGWAVLALVCHHELATEAQCREHIAPEPGIAPRFKDVLVRHAREERRHAAASEMEWRREDRQLGADERASAVADLVALFRTLDTIVQVQAASDARYFAKACGDRFSTAERRRIENVVLTAYRRQQLLVGADNPPFVTLLGELAGAAGLARIEAALLPLR